MEGDNKVVNIIEDWDVLEEYAGEKLGFYQLLANDGMFEIRVQTGRVGFKKEYKSGDDPELTKILDFCRRHYFIRVCRKLRDEEFFK
jgi:hypothetical protein